MRTSSIFKSVLSPVPRYMMRLDVIRRLLERCPKEIESFLEIGPGLGDVAAHLLERYPQCDGQLVEFSPVATAHLSQRFASCKRLRVSSTNFGEHPVAKEHDLVLAFEVLEHIENDCAALAHIHAALRPGGYFLMSVPAFMDKWEKGDDWAGHYRRYEKDELCKKLSDKGFEIIYLWNYGFPLSGILYPLRQFYYEFNKTSDLQSSKEISSQQSGINRPFMMPGAAVWMAYLLWPFFFLQYSVRNTRLGDGWILLARKRP